MKKILLLALPIIFFSAGCNATTQTATNSIQNQQTTLPSNTEVPPSTLNATPSQITLNAFTNNTLLQTYSGNGFSFEYPKNWNINTIIYVAKAPSGCGDAYGDAEMCFGMTPPELSNTGGLGLINITLTRTTQQPADWYFEKFNNSNYQKTTVNGNNAIFEMDIVPNNYTDYTFVVGNTKSLVSFQFRSFEKSYPNGLGSAPVVADYSQYLPVVKAIVNSTKFTR